MILFSMAVDGNTDIYRVPADGGTPQRLTNSPGIDTGGSYSPDGSRIVFESDRRRHAAALRDERRRIEPAPDQLRRRALCDAGVEPARRPDRLHQDRAAASASASWRPTGGGEKMLTDGWQDEGPSWAPNGRVDHVQAHGGPFRPDQTLPVGIDGGQPRRIPIPQGGTDPGWSRSSAGQGDIPCAGPSSSPSWPPCR